ncbi:MAG TPA: type II toxin-antitoxin system VapC family toxin [Thermoanaerobaculia bacterium]|nr:type II toxin-antitoxin system VapC family toxin [Thermoanaerobaculia bacterium]
MRYLLDSNVFVDIFSARPEVTRRFTALSPEAILLSSIVAAELRFGADKSAKRESNHLRLERLIAEVTPVDFDLAAAAEYGRIRADLERRGTPIGPNDLLIAAHALSLGAVLVTDNVDEFGRVKGLMIENWRASNPT